MTINLKNKQEIISKIGKNVKDSDSIEVKIAIISQQIHDLPELLKKNAED